jgi:hypothetical protein
MTKLHFWLLLLGAIVVANVGLDQIGSEMALIYCLRAFLPWGIIFV